jgi:hypothetical protein
VFDWRNVSPNHKWVPAAGEVFSPLPAPTPAANEQERKRAMTYGLSTRAFIEDGPAVQVIREQSSYSTARSWRALSAERRIALIEQALEPANDRIDAYPLAL